MQLDISEKTPDIFLGIVALPECSNLISFAVLNEVEKEFVFQSFTEDEIFESNESFLSFLRRSISNEADVQVIVAFPTIFAEESIYSKILNFLPQAISCSFICGVSNVEGKDMLFGIGEGMYGISEGCSEEKQALFSLFEKTHLVGRRIMYYYPKVAQFYANFLFNQMDSLKTIALASTLVAKNRSIYYYFLSRGLVHSSQDIVVALKYEAAESQVVSAEEVYSIRRMPYTKAEDLDKLPLKYALSEKRHESLGKRDAIKFALLDICKQWKIQLLCGSNLDKTTSSASEVSIIYDPEDTLETWITNAI